MVGLDCEAVSAPLCSAKKGEHFSKFKIREREREGERQSSHSNANYRATGSCLVDLGSKPIGMSYTVLCLLSLGKVKDPRSFSLLQVQAEKEHFNKFHRSCFPCYMFLMAVSAVANAASML